jgi:ADP-heptose:LPS heptosyltransferase
MALAWADARGVALPAPPPAPRWSVSDRVATKTLSPLASLPNPPQRYGVVAPFTSTPLKTWPLDRWRRLVAHLLREDPTLHLLVIGGPADPRGDFPRHDRLTDLCGRVSLPQTVCLLARAGFCLAGDSAPAHLSAAVGTPVLAVLGGGHPGRFFPYSRSHEEGENRALTAPLPCVGCNWVCRYRLFSERPAPCLEAVDEAEVLSAARVIAARD